MIQQGKPWRWGVSTILPTIVLIFMKIDRMFSEERTGIVTSCKLGSKRISAWKTTSEYLETRIERIPRHLWQMIHRWLYCVIVVGLRWVGSVWSPAGRFGICCCDEDIVESGSGFEEIGFEYEL
jgi:hypothetical protein